MRFHFAWVVAGIACMAGPANAQNLDRCRAALAPICQTPGLIDCERRIERNCQAIARASDANPARTIVMEMNFPSENVAPNDGGGDPPPPAPHRVKMTATPDDDGHQYMFVVLKPVPGALPELPGFPNDPERPEGDDDRGGREDPGDPTHGGGQPDDPTGG